MTRTRLVRRSLLTAIVCGVAASAWAGTVYVANNGVDGGGCGAKATPCRSIGQAIALAATGDKVIVGPGKYGDLNDNGTLGEPGEENPSLYSPGCGCVLALNKAVTLTSSNGAAETVIDGRKVGSNTNVLVITDGGAFGMPGKGFLVTQTSGGGGANGIAIDANDVTIAGNQVVAVETTNVGVGIRTVDSPGSVLIQGNQAIGWSLGIFAQGANKTVRKNVVALGASGIVPPPDGEVSGNVAVDNASNGIEMVGGSAAVLGNATIGNRNAGIHAGGGPHEPAFTGVIEKNDIFGNGFCGLVNGNVGLAADQNYWGAASGPGPDPADDVCDSGSATTSPAAVAPFKVKPSIKP